MDAKSAKTGSLADAHSADADIARAEHSLSQMQPTSEGLSSALPNDVSPATSGQHQEIYPTAEIDPPASADPASLSLHLVDVCCCALLRCLLNVCNSEADVSSSCPMFSLW